MDCPRGSECTESTHQVKTLGFAVEWSELVTDGDLPITVQQHTAHNGRARIQVRANDGRLIERRG